MQRNDWVLVAAFATLAFVLGVTVGSDLFPKAVTDDSWLFRYQALIAGALAVFAAWLASLPVRAQLRVMASQAATQLQPVLLQHGKEIARKHGAAKNIYRDLSLAQSEFSISKTSPRSVIDKSMSRIMEELNPARETISRSTAIEVLLSHLRYLRFIVPSSDAHMLNDNALNLGFDKVYAALQDVIVDLNQELFVTQRRLEEINALLVRGTI